MARGLAEQFHARIAGGFAVEGDGTGAAGGLGEDGDQAAGEICFARNIASQCQMRELALFDNDISTCEQRCEDCGDCIPFDPVGPGHYPYEFRQSNQSYPARLCGESE